MHIIVLDLILFYCVVTYVLLLCWFFLFVCKYKKLYCPGRQPATPPIVSTPPTYIYPCPPIPTYYIHTYTKKTRKQPFTHRGRWKLQFQSSLFTIITFTYRDTLGRTYPPHPQEGRGSHLPVRQPLHTHHLPEHHHPRGEGGVPGLYHICKWL